MKIYVINGSNLNFLGIREPAIYGTENYAELKREIRAYAGGKKIRVKLLQSNHEGKLVDFIQRAYKRHADGIVINPGAYTHTSIAILDAIKAVGIPTVEVHISNVDSREEFRKTSYLRPACIATIAGHGFSGYLEAIDLLQKEDKA